MAKNKYLKESIGEVDIDLESDDFEYDESSNKKKESLSKISEEYLTGRHRYTLEKSDFMLPQIVHLVRQQKWFNAQPNYQRRKVWDDIKKSSLIESLIMNIPIPPIFLYEGEVNRYEVMDGQQRLSSIVDFYENDFALSKMKFWTSLNGFTYKKLPATIQRGLDRAKLSSVVLIDDSFSSSHMKDNDIRSHVFERLNTGGIKLNHQELRNCLYYGKLNDHLVELSSQQLFTRMLRIPPHDPRPDVLSLALSENKLYRTMVDVHLVLRFFAFYESKNIRGSVKSILDNFMKNHRNPSVSDLKVYSNVFNGTLRRVHTVFGQNAFWIPKEIIGREFLSRPLFDAIMVAMAIRGPGAFTGAQKIKIRKRLITALRSEKDYEIIVGRPNTSDAIKLRIDLMSKIISAS